MIEWLFESAVQMCLTNKQDNASIDRKIDREAGSLLFLASLEAGPTVQKLGRLAGKGWASRLRASTAIARCWGFAKFQHRLEKN
jgi:hypothetical protein